MDNESLANLPDDSLNSIAPARVAGWRLKALVFISGAVLMGLEMAGSRILAIHFGSSIYVWGSIIGIFLAALSIGYFFGGMAADRWPSYFLLSALVLCAGVWLILLPQYANFISAGIHSRGLGARLEPLLATTFLFGGPSVLMGMVSPLAVRLSARGISSIGNTSGRLYALSTMGSIAGTLITAFWLIPLIGVNTILKALGLCLVVASLITIPLGRKSLASVAPLLLVAILGLLLSPGPYLRLRPDQRLIYEADSPYHHILVVDDDKTNFRFLRFNNYTQSIVDRNPPYDSNSYVNSFELARIFKPSLKRILVIGGGGAIGPRKFLARDPDVQVDLVEIDPLVMDISRDYFYLGDEARLRTFVEDGRRFVRRSQDRYDLVILDAFTVGGQIPFHLTTKEFMSEIRDLLVDDGVFLANITAALEGPKSRILRAEYKTATSVFDSLYIFPRPFDGERSKPGKLTPGPTRNIMLVALKGRSDWTPESIAANAKMLFQSGSVYSPTLEDDALRIYTGLVKVDDVPLLTDDYAPVDTMAF